MPESEEPSYESEHISNAEPTYISGKPVESGFIVRCYPFEGSNFSGHTCTISKEGFPEIGRTLFIQESVPSEFYLDINGELTEEKKAVLDEFAENMIKKYEKLHQKTDELIDLLRDIEHADTDVSITLKEM
jgi:hypothetical protein